MSEKRLELKYNRAYQKAATTMKFLERQECVVKRYANQDLINLTQWFKENPDVSPYDLLFQDTIDTSPKIGDYISQFIAIVLFIWFIIAFIT